LQYNIFYKREDIEGLSGICPVEEFMNFSYGSTCEDMKMEIYEKTINDEKNVMDKFVDSSARRERHSSMDVENVNVNTNESPTYVQRENLELNSVCPNNNSPRTPVFVSCNNYNSTAPYKNLNDSFESYLLLN
jgi:hypothetical protein